MKLKETTQTSSNSEVPKIKSALLDKYEDEHIKDIEGDMGRCIRMVACIRYGEEVRFETFSSNIFTAEQLKDIPIKHVRTKVVPQSVMKFLHNYAINFINLLNTPDVEIVEIERDDVQNKKRAVRGKIPIPVQSIIRVTGQLRRWDSICWRY